MKVESCQSFLNQTNFFFLERQIVLHQILKGFEGFLLKQFHKILSDVISKRIDIKKINFENAKKLTWCQGLFDSFQFILKLKLDRIRCRCATLYLSLRNILEKTSLLTHAAQILVVHFVITVKISRERPNLLPECAD